MKLSLVIIYGSSLGRRIQPQGDSFTIGRGPEADVKIEDQFISRLQCLLVREGPNWIIRHLESAANGTFVNDERVTERVLCEGDNIKLGGVILKCVDGDSLVEGYHNEIYRLLKERDEHSSVQNISELIAAGESATLEFKSSSRWDIRERKLNRELEKAIVKTIAGFLNAEGGKLIIGVNDSGKVIGLKPDYETLGKKQDADAYENWLTTLILDTFGKDSFPLVQINFHQIESEEVCLVDIKRSNKPRFIKDDKGEHIYIRTGNSTRLLTTREAIEYSKEHWN